MLQQPKLAKREMLRCVRTGYFSCVCEKGLRAQSFTYTWLRAPAAHAC